MNTNERKQPAESFVGKTVTIKIDRPIGFKHKNIVYPINYGYIPNTVSGDGEDIDVYLLGVSEPVSEYTVHIIGIVYRKNDIEDKLIAAPIGVTFSKEEIENEINFQERFFETYIEVLK